MNQRTKVQCRSEIAAPKPRELFIGLVGAVGTEFSRVVTALSNAFSSIGYDSSEVRLSSLLRDIPKYSNLPTAYRDQYIREHMGAGDEFRKECCRNDAVALLGVGKIKGIRKSNGKSDVGRAYLINSLKNPEEVKTLRTIYGDSFYLVAAYSPLRERRLNLAKEIAQSRNKYPLSQHFGVVDELIRKDQEEVGFDHGQQSRDSFHRADVFLDTRDAEQLKYSVNRFVELLFGNTFHTPTKSEYAVFLAHAAALRSSELGRQVGASIVDEEGEVLAVGCNEVPKAGGGVYWAGDKPDRREFQEGADSSEEQKRNMIAETLVLLKHAGWFNDSKAKLDDTELLNLAIGPANPALSKESKIRNVIEYGRAVHAEMAALTNASRKGIPVAGCTMYVTTFPCHLCARHIVSAGIKRVIYVEPYPKSLTAELYLDSISVEGENQDRKHIPFDVFVGVAPRQYQNLFTSGIRKDKDGRAIKFTRKIARLRYYELSDVYEENEIVEFKALTTIMRAKGIIKSREEKKNGRMARKNSRRS